MKIRSFLIVFLTLLSFEVFSNSEKFSKIKKEIDNYVNISPYSNFTYSIFKGEEEVSTGSFGYRDIESQTKFKSEEIMGIASGTKQMSASVIMRLRERGLIKLDDTIAKLLPSSSKLWYGNNVPDWANKITIHDLLTHSSGIPDYVGVLVFDANSSHEVVKSEIVKFAVNTALTSEPGKKYNYSNTGYFFLGLIMEEITGKKLPAIFQEELFKPLNMNKTEIVTWEKAIEFQLGKSTDLPKKYFAIPTGSKPNYLPAMASFLLQPFSDGGVTSTVEDLVKWNIAFHGGKIVNEESYKLMTTPYFKGDDGEDKNVGIGYGTYIRNHGGGITYYHSGRAIGLRSMIGFDPATDLHYAILSNVYEYIPEEMKGNIDRSNHNNRFDVLYFRNFVIDTSNSVK